jgi:hypothetical protein
MKLERIKLDVRERTLAEIEPFTLEPTQDLIVIMGDKVRKQTAKLIRRELEDEYKLHFKRIKNRRGTKPQHTHNLDLLQIELDKEENKTKRIPMFFQL